MMRFSYYNLENDWFGKKHSGWKKKKLFTITFPNSNILESIQFENSDRGHLLWISTPKTIRVFGFWSDDRKASSCKKFYQNWGNDHCGCC